MDVRPHVTNKNLNLKKGQVDDIEQQKEEGFFSTLSEKISFS